MMNAPYLPSDRSKPLAVVLDTDTYNEVDDQFALAHLLLSPDKVDLQAVYAAPFFNDRSSGPGDGMEKSLEEIQRILEVINPLQKPPVFSGSKAWFSGFLYQSRSFGFLMGLGRKWLCL